MQNLQLFLNHQPADLGADPLQLTFQINNLAEVQNQQGDFSKQFKLPLTQRNRRLLGFPDEVPLTSDTPYQLIPAKIVQDGLEIMPGGYATIEQVENDGISIIVRAGNSGFFTLLGDFKIWDMGDNSSAAAKTYTEPPWAGYDHKWSIANVAASQQKTSGWIWPIVDYGKIDKAKFSEGIDVRALRPGFFLKDAIDLIVKSTGYRLDTARSPVLQDPLYQKLIVQFAGDAFEHSKDFERNDKTSLSVQVMSTQTQSLRYGNVNVGGVPRALFTNVIQNGGNSYLTSISTYQAQANVEVDILLEYDLYFRSTKDDGHLDMNIVVWENNSDDWAVLNGDTARSDDFKKVNGVFEGYRRNGKATANITLAKGQKIYIRFEMDSDNTRGILQPGARLTITEKKTNVLYGQMVQCERIFPDITQKDLLKDTLQRFGLTCQTNAFDKTVALASFADIVKNIPKAYDWSAKCLNQGKNVSMRLGSYAQINHLKYKDDESITTVSNYNPVALAKDYFDDAINVNDKSLPPTADLLESQFAPSLNRAFTGGYIAQILKVDPTEKESDFSIGTQPRLLIDQKLKLPEGKGVNLIDGETTVPVTDVISVPYFHKPGGEYTLSWKDLDGQPGLRSNYYAELEKILKHAKKVTRYFMLNAKDIAELDLLIPVYLKQDGCYYYISMVDSWVKNQPCKVELVRLV